ncbi:ankyrin-2-like [Lineus longissimus]|uniref:ankyrin-2-like n=1 Tax=Lineus longissimus TaxID=88925 RepID=UPI002B4D9D0F
MAAEDGPPFSLDAFISDLDAALHKTSDDTLAAAILSQDLVTVKVKWKNESLYYTHPGTGLSYLQLAVTRGNLDVVTFLIKAGADVNYMAYKPNKYTNLSCLHLAVSFACRPEVFECLFNAGCDTETHLLIDSSTSLNGLTPLHIAILRNDVDSFDLLLDKAVLNVQTLGGYSPLHLTAMVDNNAMMTTLLKLDIIKQVYANNGATALYTAAKHGSSKVLKILLGNGYSVEKRVTGGLTPLHAAVLKGSSACVAALCEAGCDVEPVASAVNHKGKLLKGADALRDATPLHFAVHKGHLQCVEILLKNHANPTTVCWKKKKDENLSPLHLAVINNSVQIAELLLKHDADINAENNVGLTPLLCAVILKRTDMVEFLLKQDRVGVNKCIHGSTSSPLIYAISHELEKIALLLIQHPNIQLNQRVVFEEKDGDLHREVTLIHIALILGQTRIVEALIKYGADVRHKINFNDGEELNVSLMHNVSRYHRNDMIKILAVAGTPLDSQTNEGITPLMMAVEGPNIELMKFLLEKGADVNLQDETHDMTALMRTAEDGLIQATRLLLNTRRCDLDIQDDEGLTALHSALTYGNEVVAHMLIDHGADVNLKSGRVADRDRLTPLVLAIEYSDVRMVRRLLEKGADPNGRFMRDFTPLHLAAQLNKVQEVKDLLRFGAKINVESTRGETPIHFALYFEAMGAAEVLIRRGAQLMANGEIARYLKGTVIHYAAYKGQTEMVDLLADFGAEIYSSGESSIARDVSPLWFASRGSADQSLECFKKLIRLGCDVSARTDDGTPVACEVFRNAADSVNENRVKLLLRHGADIGGPGALTMHPSPTLLRLLIQAGIDVKSGLDFIGEVIPHQAIAKSENPDCLRLVNTFGCELDDLDINGLSALHIAAAFGRVETVTYLVNCGADINLRVKSYFTLRNATPLHIAAWKGYEDVIVKLMEAGCDFNAVCGLEANNDLENVTALHITAWNASNDDMAQFLLGHSDPNLQNSAGETALFMAVSRGNIGVFRALMGAGCYFDVGTHLLMTPLIQAVKGGEMEMVEELIQAGCNVNAEAMLSQDDDETGDDIIADFTALHVAAEKGFSSIVKMLIEAGAWLDAKETRGGVGGYTPLHCAVVKSHGDVIAILAKAGCDINAQLDSGWSALHLSAKENNMDVVKQLVNLGIDPMLVTLGEGRTASEFSHNAELTSLLVGYEASWKHKHQRRTVKSRLSLQRRISMKVMEEFSTDDYDAAASSGVVVEGAPAEGSG